MRYAQLSHTPASGNPAAVVNVIDAASGLTEWAGLPLVASTTAQMRDSYDGTAFTSPPVVLPPPNYNVTRFTMLARLKAIGKLGAFNAAAVADPAGEPAQLMLLISNSAHVEINPGTALGVANIASINAFKSAAPPLQLTQAEVNILLAPQP